jgi:nucleoside-diphosphate-sugar epimerase
MLAHRRTLIILFSEDFSNLIEHLIMLTAGHVETKPIISVVGDLREFQAVSDAVDGVDAVIHTAGLVSFGTFPDFQSMEEINVNGN